MEDRLKNLMAAVLNIDENLIGADDSMDSLESWDSLRHMRLILAVESEFNITVADADVGRLTSVKLLLLEIREQCG